ncbi:MAG: type II secretion system major pseudopilin GspG [Verrucomicrobiota bacterium]
MEKRYLSKRPRNAGFSLLEILIAVALMALLASVAITQLIGVFGDNQATAAELFINDSKLPLTRYRLDVGNFPSTAEGLAALLTAPAGKESRWKGPYVTEQPIDPWGKPYQYRYPGTKNVSGARGFDIWSLGEDGSESADDIGNWK